MSNNQQIMLNRIKVVLAEKQRTNRWLAEQWVSPRIQFQDGVPISHNHPLICWLKLQNYLMLTLVNS